MKKIFITTVIILLLFSTLSISINAEKTKKTDETNKQTMVYDLLIITPKEFTKSLMPLKYHKEKMGVKTKISTTTEIYKQMYWQGRDCAEKIKYYIKSAIENWGIKYVLLVGGIKDQFSLKEKWWLPVRYVHLIDRWSSKQDYHEYKYLSDLYFADIYDSQMQFSSWDSDNDGIYGEWRENESAEDILDLVPDVMVGRLPCINNLDVKIVVDKIINYERSTCFNSWFENMVVVAGDTYIGNDYYEGEVETQLALDFMPDFNHIKLWTSLDTFNGESDVYNAVNNGCGFLYFAGHGSPVSWATHPPNDNSFIDGLRNYEMYNLRNAKKLPVCIVGGCHNSMFNISLFRSVFDKKIGLNTWTYGSPALKCFGWALVSKIIGGAIATISNTALSYGNEDKLDPSAGGAGGHLNMCFFEAYNNSKSHILGECWGDAIGLFLEDYPIDWDLGSYDDTSIDAKTVQQWVLLGDPSLKIGGYN